MQAPRHIGIDLHRNKFTCCVRLDNGRNYLSDWKLEDLPRFVKKLRSTDEIAVEVTGNTRLFYDAVAPQVARVVAVDPNQFKVISHSVKKTDPNDARNLALYLEKDLLPEVRMKDRTQAQLASLTQTRDTLVKLRTSLKNKVNNILSAHGINLEKEALSGEKKLQEVLAMQFDPMVQIELEVIVDEIRSLNQRVAKLEKTIAEEGSKLEGHKNLTSIKGIGPLSEAFCSVSSATSMILTVKASWLPTSASCRACQTPTKPSTRAASPNAAANWAVRHWCSALSLHNATAPI